MKNTHTKSNTTQSTNVSAQTLLALGAGVAAVATASYYFFGPKGKDHRDDFKGWMIKMKGEIIERIEDVKELTEPVYNDIVDSVVATYATTSKVSKEELVSFALRLKSQWQDIVASTKARAELGAHDARRTMKRAASKVVRNAKTVTAKKK